MKRLTPPKWAHRFLQWYCDPEILEDIEGDLYELYQHRLVHTGKAYADAKFVWEVLRLVRPPLLRSPLKTEKKMYIVIDDDTASSDVMIRVLPLLPWNDIVFESRNKDYGAYRIRNSYGRNMLLGFSVVLLISVLIVVWWWTQLKP